MRHFFFVTFILVSFVGYLQAAEVPPAPRVIELKGHGTVCNLGFDYPDTVYFIAFSRDGKKIATGCEDGTFRIWDTESGKELQKIEGNFTNVNFFPVAFAPDGKTIIATSSNREDRNIRIWDTESGRELRTLGEYASQAVGFSFSPDGKKVAVIQARTVPENNNAVRILEFESGKELQKLEGHNGGVSAVAFSSDGKKIVTVGYKSAYIWDAESGKELQKLVGHDDSIPLVDLLLPFVTFSPDGKRIVSLRDNGTLQTWDAESRTALQKLDMRPISSFALSPDGKKIVGGSYYPRIVQILDAKSGKELQKLNVPQHIYSVAFSPDGKKIAVGGFAGFARIFVLE